MTDPNDQKGVEESRPLLSLVDESQAKDGRKVAFGMLQKAMQCDMGRDTGARKNKTERGNVVRHLLGSWRQINLKPQPVTRPDGIARQKQNRNYALVPAVVGSPRHWQAKQECSI